MHSPLNHSTLLHSWATATTVYVLQSNIKEQSDVPLVHYELNMNYGLR